VFALLAKIQKHAKIIKGFFGKFAMSLRRAFRLDFGFSSDKKEGMAKRGGRQVFLGVQWDRGSWDNLPTLCDRIINTVGERPILWNFPAIPSESLQRIRTWLLKALNPRLDLDLVAPMGYAGACLPVLTLEELEKEISWGRENPWGTGISQVLGIRPEVLMPRVADVLRTDARAAYRRHGFKTLGILGGRGTSWFVDDGLEYFTCTRIPVAGFDGTRRPKESDTLLILDLSGAATVQVLGEALEIMTPWLAPLGVPSPLTATRSASRRLRELTSAGLDWSPFPAPLLRQALSAVNARVRKKRKKNDEYRELLCGLSLGSVSTSPAAPAGAKEEAPTGDLPGGSHLVAQMLGDVSLAGNGFDVRLSSGRFTGITRDGRDLLPLRPARSYLRVGGKRWTFRTKNSFSFEGDEGTGLREVLGIDSQENASLSIEYAFCEGSPLLEITAEIRWPAFAAGAIIDENAPFVITLGELGRAEEAVIWTEAPDGSVSSVHAGLGSWVVMPGCFHRITLAGGGALLLRAGPAESHGWHLASFRVTREGRKRFLEANPFGGWIPLPASLLSERREKFSLLIGIEE